MISVAVWFWDISTLEPNSPTLQDWADAGVSRVLVKCGDGSTGGKWASQFATLAPQIRACGMSPWAWQYVYGAGDETGPAIAALNAGADGFVIDAEIEWEQSPTADPTTYVAALRAAANGKPIMLSSFGQPNLHLGMMWKAWDDLVDGYLPQDDPSAWGLSIADALTLSYQKYAGLGLTKPLWPAGYLYPQPPAPTVVDPADVTEFLGQATAGGYDAVSFWRDGIMGADCVSAIASFLAPPAPTIEERVAKIEGFLTSLGSTFKEWTT